MLINKKVWRALPREPDHALVEIFDPPFHYFASRQFDRNRRLLLAQSLQVDGFLASLIRRRRFGLFQGQRIAEGHPLILHPRRTSQMHDTTMLAAAKRNRFLWYNRPPLAALLPIGKPCIF